MRFTRWWDHSLPQTLTIGAILLYVNAAFGAMSVLGLGFSSPYELVPFVFLNRIRTIDGFDAVQTISVFAGTAAYLFAALGIVNSQKIGWKVGVAVAAGAVLLPVYVHLFVGRLDATYIIGFLFDLALLVALLHPQSREHQRIWFHGSSRGPRPIN